MTTPYIGISTDADPERVFCRHPYIDAVIRAGGIPLLLPAAATVQPQMLDELLDAMLAVCSGVILTGGDDPRTELFGEPTHPRATPVEPRRQAFEVALLDRLAAVPDLPVLGICLGMQMMALHAGGRLDQHLPDHGDHYAIHWGKREHPVRGALGDGVVTSHHRQAVIDPGSLTVIADAPDGVIEGIRHPDRAWHIGVQWHPEITADDRLGTSIITALIENARAIAFPRQPQTRALGSHGPTH